jgi:hypothetical protein
MASTSSPGAVKHKIEAAMDGFEVDYFVSLLRLSLVTGEEIDVLTAFLVLGNGEGRNYRLSYQGLSKGLKRTR